MPSHLRLLKARSILERRLFLKAVGLGLAAPIALKLARSATAQTSGAPKRFFVMYLPHGIAPEHFNPRMTGPGNDPRQFALDMSNESTLGPLQPYKEYVNVYQGFQFTGDYPTHEGIVNILSGANTGDTTTPRITLDHVIGKGLGVKPLILGACSHNTWGLDLHGMLFWDGATAIDPEKNPAVAADKVFGTGAPAPSADAQLRNAMLDLTISEIEELQTSVSGLTREQSKLQTHLDSVKAVKEGGGSGQSSCTTVPTLPTVEKVRMESAGKVPDPGGGNDYFYDESNFRTLLQAQLEIVSQALICNAAQVIGLMPMYATAEFNFSFIGGSPGSGGWAHHNGISHTGYQQVDSAQYDSPLSIDNVKPETRAAFGKAQRWFFEQLVTNVVSTLATTPDPSASDGSTVLDNTLIFVLSEVGDGANHTRASAIEYPRFPAYLPLVTIGKAGGALASGQVITSGELVDIDKKPGNFARPTTDLFLTLAKAMGVDATFPSTTGVVEGVLT